MNHQKLTILLGGILIGGTLILRGSLNAQRPWPEPPTKSASQKVNAVNILPNSSVVVTKVDAKGNEVEKKIYPPLYVKLVSSLFNFVSNPQKTIETFKKVIKLDPGHERFLTVSLQQIYEILIGDKLVNLQFEVKEEDENENKKECSEESTSEIGCAPPMCPTLGGGCVFCGVQ